MQETLLAAWRAFDGFAGAGRRSGPGSYRIATNRSLNALRDASRRPGGAPDLPPEPPEPTRVGEPLWLQPYPDALLDAIPDSAPGPEQRYEAREAVGLAFVAGLQRLPPSQRAILVLRDVLGYRANEVAEMLDTTTASVNSGLQRARAALEARHPASALERAPLPRSDAERRLVGRFADALRGRRRRHGRRAADGRRLADDAAGAAGTRAASGSRGSCRSSRRTATCAASGSSQRARTGSPRSGCTCRDPQCPIAHASGILVLTLQGERIAALTAFHDTGVFPLFGLPRTLPLD